jgi:hypothetical protein
LFRKKPAMSDHRSQAISLLYALQERIDKDDTGFREILLTAIKSLIEVTAGKSSPTISDWYWAATLDDTPSRTLLVQALQDRQYKCPKELLETIRALNKAAAELLESEMSPLNTMIHSFKAKL